MSAFLPELLTLLLATTQSTDTAVEIRISQINQCGIIFASDPISRIECAVNLNPEAPPISDVGKCPGEGSILMAEQGSIAVRANIACKAIKLVAVNTGSPRVGCILEQIDEVETARQQTSVTMKTTISLETGTTFLYEHDLNPIDGYPRDLGPIKLICS